LRDRDERGGIYGRQQHKSPGTKVSVAGHKAGRIEPEDQGRDPLEASRTFWDGGEEKRHIEPKNDRSIGSPKQKRSSQPAVTRILRDGDEMGGSYGRQERE
jgi:hypothetical protein